MEFAVLGPLEVRDAGRVVPLRRGLPSALVTLLVLQQRVPLSVDVIAERLWGDDQPAHPRNTVQQLVAHLRRALGAGADALLVTQASRYALLAVDDDVDIHRFERLLDEAVERTADATGAGAEDALLAVEAALAMWRGDPLADVARYEWAEPDITRCHELALRLRETRVSALLTLGRNDQAVAAARSLVESHPLREQVHADLGLALYRAGRQGEALRVLASARRLLATELGLDPGPGLQLIERRILNHDEGLRWVPPADLDTVQQQQRPLPLTGVAPLRPPTPHTSLIGREADIDALVRVVDQAPLVTLTGPGGAGKTRIAGELARRRTDRPVWFVDLSVLAGDELVASTTARAVGAVHGPEQSPVDAIVRTLRDRPGLLVLDNCEHVIEAAGELAATLLRGCPALVQVATSRRPLRVSGEVTWPVPPLATPDSEDLGPADVTEVAAVRLFVDRARAVRPDFALDDDNVADVAAIVRSLDGLPLAIELAAAHADVLTAPSIRRRLRDRFELLESEARDAPARQRTLRAVIDSSVSLLDDPEKHFFVRLGAFAGSFDLAAAGAVTASPDAFRTTASLVRQSLVVTTGTDRYRLLESVRAYAAQALASQPDVVEVRSRHCEHLIALMTQADTGIRADGQDVWLTRIHDSLPDIRSALGWSLGGAAPARGALLAARTNWFWTLEGMLTEAARWLALAETAPLGDDSIRAAVLLAGGRIAAPRGDLAKALTACAESAAISRRLGDHKACADALLTLGIAQWATGDLAGAAISHEQAAALAGAAGDTFVRDAALALRARTAVDAGEPTAGLLIDEAVGRARRSREKHRIGLALSQLARHALLTGDARTAYNAAQESLSHWQAVGYREGQVNALNLLARASTELDRPAEAEDFAVRALRVAAAIGHKGALCQSSETLAGVMHARGLDERAALLLAVAREERQRSGIPSPVAEAAPLGELARAVREKAGSAAELAERQATYLSVEDLLDRIESDRA